MVFRSLSKLRLLFNIKEEYRNTTKIKYFDLNGIKQNTIILYILCRCNYCVFNKYILFYTIKYGIIKSVMAKNIILLSNQI